MMQDEFQDSNSSKDSSDELVIKPPQTSSELSYVSKHSSKKKRKHSEEHKSSRRHHHHKTSHLKSSNGNCSTRNQNIESKSFHYRSNRHKNQNRESKRVLEDQDMIDARSKKLIKYVTMNDRERNVECGAITDIRHVKEIRESSRCSNKNENICFLEKMKVEWRKKRLQWLQQQTFQDKRMCIEKEEDDQDKNYEGEFKEQEQHENMHMEHSRSQKNRVECLQIDDKNNYSLISPVPSEEESIDRESEKSEKLIDDENEYVSDQEDAVTMSDISDDDESLSKSENENEGIESTDKNKKVTSQEESFYTESAETITTFKKENQNANSMRENGISAVSQVKCPTLVSVDLHTPKRPVYCPAIQGCRSIDGFHVLNRIEEGTYGVVYRAKDKETKEIVALKRLKMEREKEGFPITSLREINTLLKAQHPNIVTVREIVVGSNMDRIYIVMDYVEHDLKSLMKTMPRPFVIGEVKTLLMQLLCAVAHLHDNWILHRDLKTSNLLLSHQGILKVGDFGLAREYGSPLKSYTPVVVTLWYRAPELLLGVKKYSTAIDMWSVGCIFGELLTKNALFPGKSESDQINRIFKDLGTPSEHIWPGYSELPLVQSMNITQYPYNILKGRFSHTFSDVGLDLLNKFLTYNPARRIPAEKAKSHEFFNENPKPVPPNMFPTWPAKSEQEYRTARSSPKPPLGGIHYSKH